MEQRKIDEQYMRRCLQLARCGREGAAPNPMVGAVVVCQGRIIGEGYHQRCGEAHAEVNAIRSVRDKDLLRQSTIYVSLEPCAHYGKTPPCAQLIIDMGIPTVVVGCRDPFPKVDGRGIDMLREAGIEVRTGVLEEECLWLNRRFITFHTQHRPYITLKWAQSKDGLLDRKRQSDEQPAARLSSPVTQTLVHRLRALNNAILVGRRTWELDHPGLNVRHWVGSDPLPIVLSSKGCSVGSDMIDIETTDLHPLMNLLYEKGVQTLMVEGGTQTLQGFIDQGLWDEARIETSPLTLGDGIPAPQISGKMGEKLLIGGHTVAYIYKNS